MKGKLKYSGLLASLALVLVAGLPGFAIAQQAKLYEIVENLDVTFLPGSRVSHWTAQGTAEVGSPFCPATVAVLSTGASSCTITAFGRDDIDLKTLAGTVWANVVAVANPIWDNPVDPPELPTFSGQITGKLVVVPPNGEPVEPDLGKKKSLMGPAIPLLYVRNGKFFPDAVPVIRTSPPAVLPKVGHTANFNSTFRLPFTVTHDGRRVKPERGKKAFYLGDDGSLIKVDKQDEFALGFPLLRAEVYFK